MHNTIADRQPFSARRKVAKAHLVGPAAVHFISVTFRFMATVQFGYIVLWLYHCHIASDWQILMYGNRWVLPGETNFSDGLYFLYDYVPFSFAILGLWGLGPLAREYMLRHYLRRIMYNPQNYSSICVLGLIGSFVAMALWIIVLFGFEPVGDVHVVLQLMVLLVWGMYTLISSLFIRGHL